ncbi:AAA family ATPase [Streptomyces mobaraensis]|uniref:AAA family ATPase n=1 Tax=Streptomyces mobaraensis TaxID=35621 RepID=UPI0033172934
MLLISQKSELALFETALGLSRTGTGEILLIEGAAGSGKSELMETFAAHAEHDGATVLTATGSATDRAVPLSTLQQLLDRTTGISLADLPVTETGALTRESLRLLHQALNRIAAESPLVVCVDDLHLTDPATQEFLLHLAKHGRRSPILLVLSQTLHYTPLDAEFSTELLLRTNLHRIQTRPMSTAEVTAAVAASTLVGPDEAGDLAAELHRISGGNPLLIRALIFEQSAARLRPLHRLSQVVLPQFGGPFARAAFRCLQRCGEHALALATATIVLGERATPELVAQLTDLTLAEAEQGLSALEAARLLDGRGYRHPVVQATVLENLPPSTVAGMHRRLAEILHRTGADAETVTQHLMDSHPGCGSDDLPVWASDLLNTAVDQAVRVEDIDRAARLLTLARDTCHDPDRRVGIITRLSGLVWQVDPARSEQYLAEAIAAARSAPMSSARLKPLFQLLFAQGRIPEAAEVRGLLPDAAGDEAPAEDLQPHSYALDDTHLPDIERFLQATRLTGPTLTSILQAITSLILSAEPQRGVAWCQTFLEQALRSDSPGWHSLFSALLAQAQLRRGDLESAERHAVAALESLPDRNCDYAFAPLATLLRARTEMGRYPDAAAIVHSQGTHRTSRTIHELGYLRARARYYSATRQFRAALDDLYEIGRLMKNWDMDHPLMLPWRTEAAEVLLKVGQQHQADRLVLEQLAMAEARHPWIRGTSLRLRAVMSDLRKRPALLHRAVAELGSSGDRVQTAHAKAELSEALLALGDPLAGVTGREALALASECRAGALQKRIQAGVLAPADPCPPAVPAFDPKVPELSATLSESERRVASLAALKYSNREISEALHITVSTVEQHLTRVYRKLRITRRSALPASLELWAMDSVEAI